MPTATTLVFGDGATDIASVATATAVSDSTAMAIVQIVQLDPRSGTTLENGHLVLRPALLRDRRFLGGTYQIDPNSRSDDFKRLLPLWSVIASTGVLISPTRVLMAGHAVIRARLDETYFVFGRTADSSIAAPGADGLIRVPPDRFRRATSIVAIENPVPDSKDPAAPAVPDWAVLELDAAWTGAAPLPLGVTTLEALAVYSHPLGVPMQRSEARPSGVPGDSSRLICDFASGGSGSPVIQAGKVVGIVSGNARFVLGDVRDDKIHIRPVEGTPQANQMQPITPASHILDVLSKL